MEYENLTLKELQNLCIDRDLKKSGTKAELIERLFENDGNYSEFSNSQSDDSFSFAGIIVAVIFGYITYKFCLPLAKGIDNVYRILNSDDLLIKSFLEYLDDASYGKFSNALSFFRKWFWVLLISYGIKTIISLSHAFYPSRYSIFYIAWTAIILEVAPVFFKYWSISTIKNACFISIIVYIPTILIIMLLWNPKDQR